MNTELAIWQQDGEIRCVLLDDGRPVEYLTGNSQSSPRRQDILLGKVSQVMPALACVFIDIGDTHDAMLPMGEAPVNVKPGQPIMVQVRRETGDGKGHQVTTRIRLPGPFAVYNPQGAPKRRSKLAALDPLQQQALFKRDLQRLEQTWLKISGESGQGRVPRPLLQLGDPLYTALISCVSAETTRILIEGDELFSQVYKMVQEIMPPYLPLLALHIPRAGYGLSAVLSLGNLADEMQRRKIWLDGGGFIVIDKTEALTVIDVNSGKDIRGAANDQLRIRTNQEAALEIARQLRLRNIGGGIIIDFLNLGSDETRAELAETLTQALSRDRAHCHVLGFTGLGLLEMSRSAL